MQTVLPILKALSEITRFRIFNLLSKNELIVTEIVNILGQSQPCISRHLKILCQAGLLKSNKEGSWVFYQIDPQCRQSEIYNHLISLVPQNNFIIQDDEEKLKNLMINKNRKAQKYFQEQATQWDKVRSLFNDNEDVEKAITRLLPSLKGKMILDVATGTGKLLELLSPQTELSIGVDMSHEMLEIARSRFRNKNLSNCQARHANMYHLPFNDETFDLTIIHQVLHYANHPKNVLSQAERVLKNRGHMLIVNFAPHDQEKLRRQHYHRHLGLSEERMNHWLEDLPLEIEKTVHIPSKGLPVFIWLIYKKESVDHKKNERLKLI